MSLKGSETDDLASRIANLGTVFSGNNFWTASGFYAPSSSPTVGRGNMVTSDGSTYAAVPDI